MGAILFEKNKKNYRASVQPVNNVLLWMAQQVQPLLAHNAMDEEGS